MNILFFRESEVKDIRSPALGATETCTLECLNLTGDLGTHEAVRSSRMDHSVREEGYRARLRERAIMVARSKE